MTESLEWPDPLPPCADWRDVWEGCEKDMGCGARCLGNQPRKKDIDKQYLSGDGSITLVSTASNGRSDMTPRWIKYFMEMAEHAASISKDPSTKVGAVAVDAELTVLATGFNGLPRRVADLPERMERPRKYLFTSHAEQNLVAFAASSGRSLKGAAVFVTHYPCATCARLLIQAGVAQIYAGNGTTSMPVEEFDAAREMLTEAGVKIIRVED